MFKFFATTNLNLYIKISVIQLFMLQHTHSALITFRKLSTLLKSPYTCDATDTEIS